MAERPDDVKDPYTLAEQALRTSSAPVEASGVLGDPQKTLGDRDGGRDRRRGVRIEMSAMDMHEGPIWRMAHSLALQCRSGGGDEVIERLKVSGLALGDSENLYQLARRCHGSTDREWSGAALRALLFEAGQDEMAMVTLLVGLQPGFLVLVRRLVIAGMDHLTAQSEVISAAYERAVLAIDRRPTHVARFIIGGTWDQLRWALKAEQRCALRQMSLDSVGDIVDGPLLGERASEIKSAAGELNGVLRDAVAARVISTMAAQIVQESRIGGRSLQSLACEHHKGEAAVRRARQRAEVALALRARHRAVVADHQVER